MFNIILMITVSVTVIFTLAVSIITGLAGHPIGWLTAVCTVIIGVILFRDGIEQMEEDKLK